MNKELEPVLTELRAVLKKHDVTGLLIVGNKTHVDFTMEVEASWSCATIDMQDTQYGIRLKALAQDFPDKAKHNEVLADTIGMFVTFNDVMRHVSDNLGKLLIKIGGHIPFVGRSTRED